jgi:hypothetical protein
MAATSDTRINQHKAFAGESVHCRLIGSPWLSRREAEFMIGNPATGEPDVVVVGAGIMRARSHYHIDVSAIAAKQPAMLKKTGRRSI